MRDIDSNTKIDLRDYSDDADHHEYVESLSNIEETDAKQLLDIGVDVKEQDRLGTFIQKDKSIIHCQSREKGVDVMGISNALKKHPWLKEYVWKNISPETDQFTGRVKAKPHDGYFIHAQAGAKAKHPVQSCLYIAKDGFSQNVHNIVIAEEDSELHIITGCATAPHLLTGLHIGVSEFYVKKRAKLTFTMIHDWGERVSVRPRTVMQVEEGGIVVSNYISLRPVGSLQMFPTTRLVGAGAVARFNSILVAGHGSHLDVGSRIVLDAPHTRAEIISRGISSGGDIIARGNLEGMSAGIKAHLECKGLILNNGMMKAIPELTAYVPGVEMSHEAAVGKIDQREIEYLMARGLDEDSAISTIVRGFLNVDIEGLPSGLKEKLDKIVVETQKDMM